MKLIEKIMRFFFREYYKEKDHLRNEWENRRKQHEVNIDKVIKSYSNNIGTSNINSKKQNNRSKTSTSAGYKSYSDDVSYTSSTSWSGDSGSDSSSCSSSSSCD